MYGHAVVVLVLILLSVEGLQAQNQTEDEIANAAIEFFNDCKCVLEYQCDLNNYIITNGYRVIGGRIGGLVNRIKCNGGRLSNERVCCKLNGTNSQVSTWSSTTASTTSISTTASTTSTSTTASTTSTSTTARSTTLESSVRGPDTDNQIILDPEIKCGIPKPRFDVRIHNIKEDLKPIDSEFPWIAAIFKRTTSDAYKFLCSGSLIHPNVVLTINHCVHRKRSGDLEVVVNGKVRHSISDATPEEKREVSEIINHPRYNDKMLYNDAALLIVERPFVIQTWNNINTLCLPPNNFYLEGKKCLVAGWGDDNEGQNVRSLRKVEVPFVNHTHCQDLLRKTALGGSFNLHPSFTCAGGEKERDACIGDGGSPLMCQTREGSGQYFQAGIVSWGIGCGKESVPGVYTNVGVITEWIRDALSIRQLNI